jgi:hypothetical protein
MSLDEFLKGLKVFNEGISSYAQSEVLFETNESLKDLNKRAKDVAARQSATTQATAGLQSKLDAVDDRQKQLEESRKAGTTTEQDFQLQREQLNEQREELTVDIGARRQGLTTLRGQQAEILEERTNLAQETRLSLGRAGASPSTIAATTQGIGISDAAKFQQQENIRAQKASQRFTTRERLAKQEFSAGETAKKIASDKQIASLKASRDEKKQAEARRKSTLSAVRLEKKGFLQNIKPEAELLKKSKLNLNRISKARAGKLTGITIAGGLSTQIAKDLNVDRMTDEDFARSNVLKNLEIRTKQAAKEFFDFGTINKKGVDDATALKALEGFIDADRKFVQDQIAITAVNTADSLVAAGMSLDDRVLVNSLVSEQGMSFTEDSFKALQKRSRDITRAQGADVAGTTDQAAVQEAAPTPTSKVANKAAPPISREEDTIRMGQEKKGIRAQINKIEAFITRKLQERNPGVPVDLNSTLMRLPADHQYNVLQRQLREIEGKQQDHLRQIQKGRR